MMKMSSWLSLLGFIVLLFAIFFGGPKLSAYWGKKYREKVDKNGIILKALVYKKKTFKGRTVHFSYFYNGAKYTNNQQSDCFFDMLSIRDTIFIKIDTLDPGDSYIQYPECK